MHTYTLTADGKYSVGFYSPNGVFVVVTAYAAEADAIKRVNFLNGGTGAAPV